jgi:hypothetical protein
MLRTLGWLLHTTPFCIRVNRPFRFLRHNAYLRRTAGRRRLLDVLAFTGIGPLGLRAMTAAKQGLRRAPAATAEVVDSFGPWADELWESCKSSYQAIAVRDSASMNVLIPQVGWPPATRLRVKARGQDVGWAAVMETAMSGDERFGDLRVGSVVDCLARPEDAALVISAAWNYLRDRAFDVVVSNQAHPDWARGFAANGFSVLPNRRIFAASPMFAAELAPIEETGRGLHLTNLDGHGPMAL